MTNFIGGPADGKVLGLRRSPVYLRVVIGRRGVDALDQLRDTPAAGETCYCYVREGEPRGVRVRPGGRMNIATYRYRDEQPPQKVMLSNRDWAEWVLSVYRPEEKP